MLIERLRKQVIQISNPSKEVQQIEGMLASERDAMKRTGGHPERIEALNCAIMQIRRGDYRQAPR